MNERDADELLARVRDDHVALARFWRAHSTEPFPGRAAALLAWARSLGRPLPAEEYVLPEHTLEWLLERARKLHGRKVPLLGSPNHKGRVGDGVERLLFGGKVAGMAADHPAAELKSVPVRGDVVVERVKLGVLSPKSNPLKKCDCILFVFVEPRGDDFFIVDHHAHAFELATWRTMWNEGFIVETAAGSPARPARGLYLVPRWFAAQGIWPRANFRPT